MPTVVYGTAWFVEGGGLVRRNISLDSRLRGLLGHHAVNTLPFVLPLTIWAVVPDAARCWYLYIYIYRTHTDLEGRCELKPDGRRTLGCMREVSLTHPTGCTMYYSGGKHRTQYEMCFALDSMVLYRYFRIKHYFRTGRSKPRSMDLINIQTNTRQLCDGVLEKHAA